MNRTTAEVLAQGFNPGEVGPLDRSLNVLTDEDITDEVFAFVSSTNV